VTGHSGADSLPEALKDADLVIIPAGVPRAAALPDCTSTASSDLRGACSLAPGCAYVSLAL